VIRDMSALGRDSVGIDIPDLYDNLEPKKGGLIDTRMGVTDNHIDCATCGLSSNYCPGHFGHIVLIEPAFHIGYLDYVIKILKSVCLKCSKLLIYKNDAEIAEMLKTKSGEKRFAEIRNLVKNVTHCQKENYGCGNPVSKIKKDVKRNSGAINIISETIITSQENEEGGEKTIKKEIQILTPENCYDILSNISDTDCLILGFDPKKCRLEDLIHKIFPVPPVPVRPSAKADYMASSTREDDLTHKLADIVKANIKLMKQRESLTEASSKYGQDYLHLLQFHIATYFDNESVLPRAEQKGKPLKSLAPRLKGKEGRIRFNLMGEMLAHNRWLLY
jgi:DNA-directed RNA polymerase II subunit RPB1